MIRESWNTASFCYGKSVKQLINLFCVLCLCCAFLDQSWRSVIFQHLTDLISLKCAAYWLSVLSSVPQTCPSLASTRATMTSTWSYATIVDRWWSRRHLRSTASGDMAHWRNFMPGYVPLLLHPNLSRGPTMATLHPMGPTQLLFHPGRAVVKGWGSCGQPRLLLQPHLNTDTRKMWRMQYGKRSHTKTLHYLYLQHVFLCSRQF